MQTFRRIAVLLCALLFALPAFAAELTGQIKGQVTDEQNLAVPGVTLIITSESMMGDRGETTDADGRFRFSTLPIGSYRVEASLPGFNTWVASDVRVTAGGTATLAIEMSAAEAGMEIVIEAERPIVDTESVQAGLSLRSEQLKDLPTGRDYQSAVSFSPGVVGGGNPNVRGGMDNQNQFYVDGVNVTDPMTNTFSMNMNYDAMEEVQTITGGMDAEYGRALGGAVNVVTKSGGNEFEAMATVFYADERFKVYPEQEWDDKESDQFSNQSYALNVGGPIIKDKVWFFVSGQMDVLERRTVFDNAVVGRPEGDDVRTPWDDEMSEIPARDWRSRYLFGKVTAQPTDQHRVWVHLQADPTKILNTEQDPYTLPSGEGVQEQGGWLSSAGHIWSPRDDMNVETQAYFQTNYINFYPILWEDCKNVDDLGACQDDFETGWLANDPDGFSYGEYSYASFNKRDRMSLSSALSYYPDFLGNHRLKIGGQIENMKTYTVYPGLDEDGFDYYNHNGDPADLDGYTPGIAYIYDNNLEATLTGTMISAFVQDVWQPIDRLTIRPGLRLDKPILRNDINEVVFTATSFAPRIGAAFDVRGDGQTKLHAYYGRFTDPGFLAVADLLVDKSSGYGVYSWDELSGDWADEPGQTVASSFLAHDDLKPPTSDQFDFGITQALGDNTALSFTWANKQARGFWEDDEVNLIWNEEGTDVIGFRNGKNEAQYRLRTSPDRYYKVNSLETVINGQYDNWWLSGSYTWSRAYGNQDDQIATATFDTYPQIPYEEGILSYDRTHVIKLFGTQTREDLVDVGPTSLGYVAGWSYYLASGYPYRKTYYNDYYAGWSNYASSNDGTLRLPTVSQLDLKTGLVIGAGPTHWALTLECFNVLNDRTVTSVDQTWEARDHNGVYLDENDEPLFGRPLAYQDPREFRVGIRGEF